MKKQPIPETEQLINDYVAQRRAEIAERGQHANAVMPRTRSHEALRELDVCLACGMPDLIPFLDLGKQPLANTYHDGSADLPRYPLVVQRCVVCGHCQLTHAVMPDLLFRDYAYVSGTSETLRQWMVGFARQVASDFNERCDTYKTQYPRVLDIACNDGTLMEAFIAAGCEPDQVWGVDPADNLWAMTGDQKHLNTLLGYWDAARATSLLGLAGAPFDIITAFNVLAHTADPLGFLQTAVEALAPGGRLYIMTSQAHWLDDGQFDYWYHEHLSAFTPHSLSVLARRAGLDIEQVTYPAIHGGSMLAELSAPYHDMALRAKQTAQDLRETVASLRSEGYTVVGYGAAAKGNTLLNYAGVDLDWIVDDNPGKWDKLTPGRDIPIHDPGGLVATAAGARLAIVLLAWNFADEIKARVKAIRGDAETVYVWPFPDVRVERC